MKEKHQRSGHRDTSFTPSEHQRLTFGKMDSETSWLDKKFLEDILKKENSLHAEVLDFDTKRAVGRGDNYASLLSRVTVNFKQKNGSDCKDNNHKMFLIVKSFPTNEIMAEFIGQARLFDKEIHMYQVTLPAIYNILNLQSTLLIKPFTAKCFPTSRENTLVLEDLAENGFKMANRRERLDFAHCILAMRALARFHALTVVIQNEHPDMISFYTESMFTEKSKEMSVKFVDLTFNTLGSIVETWPGYEDFGQKIRNLSGGIYDKMMEIVKPKEGKLNVLNHGDFWVNNMLFKYSDLTGKVEDIRMIDFQVCRFCSPSLDLLYFMYTSPCDEVREKKMDMLLEEYYTTLIDTLSTLNMKQTTFTLENLKADMEENILFGVYTACTVLSAVVADPNCAIDVESMTKESLESGEINPMEKPYKGARFREVFQKLLIHFQNKGVL